MASLEGKTNSSTENRVKTTGEVFTPDSIVRDMLDETDRKLKEYYNVDSVDSITDEDYIDYIVMEPTCGSGNFLVRILERKLKRVQKHMHENWEPLLLGAVASIHGIDITAENVVLSKLRMLELIKTGTTDIFEIEYKEKEPFSINNGFKLSKELEDAIKYILDRNIQCGNTLTCEKLLMWKSAYIRDNWEITKDQISLSDSLVRTSDLIGTELSLTQYDILDDGRVATRERSYIEMIENTSETYRNTTDYIHYSDLKSSDLLIYEEAVEEQDADDLDF